MSTVLVVEDSVTQRKMSSLLLKVDGLCVSGKSGSMEAWKRRQRDFPDLVGLDIVIPQMNSYQGYPKLKTERQTQNKVFIIKNSSQGREVDYPWNLRQGAEVQIAKPFRSAELAEKLHCCKEGR